MSDKELVRKLYIDLCEASINKDLIKLDEILSDDYVFVHMTGMKQTKEDYLDSVKSGELSYFESKHESIDVNVNGEDYSAEYYLGDYQQQTKDNNPKYDLIITNLTSNYETEVLIKKK